jgi:hypothetical protein
LDKWREEPNTHTSNRIPSIAADPFWLWFVAIVAFAFVLRLGLAIALPNVFRPDEIGQNLEPAFRMWLGGGITYWEWHEGIRSPIFPGFLAELISLSARFGLGPAGYLAVIASTLLCSRLASSGSASFGDGINLFGVVALSVVCSARPGPISSILDRSRDLTWISWTKLCERMSLGKELGYAEEEA